MNYTSTRGKSGEVLSAAQIIKQGLALDGGLFVPESIPALTENEVQALCKMSYPERAATVLSKYLSDYTYEELLADCEKAYSAALPVSPEVATRMSAVRSSPVFVSARERRRGMI